MRSADVIITNAKIFTSDESNPHAEAVAVRGNRIVYVGTNEGVESFKNQSTHVIDAQGHTLTAGFIDTHVHLLWGSIWLGSAQLQEVRTKEDLKNILLDFASQNKTDPWVVGRGIRYGIVSTPGWLGAGSGMALSPRGRNWMRFSQTGRCTSAHTTVTPAGRIPGRSSWAAF
jgi:hypothetical protein